VNLLFMAAWWKSPLDSSSCSWPRGLVVLRAGSNRTGVTIFKNTKTTDSRVEGRGGGGAWIKSTSSLPVHFLSSRFLSDALRHTTAFLFPLKQKMMSSPRELAEPVCSPASSLVNNSRGSGHLFHMNDSRRHLEVSLCLYFWCSSAD